MDDESLEKVIAGIPLDDDEPRSRGIKKCLLLKTLRYDLLRHHVNRDIYCAWDFFLETDLGTLIALHPDFTSLKVACYKGIPATAFELPATGKGGSSGRGTFRRFKTKKLDVTLRFEPMGSKGKGKGPTHSCSSTSP